MARLSITTEIHHFLSPKIDESDNVIDATLGNGHDALFLAKLIGDSGHLFGFDIQTTAIDNTNRLLMDHGVEAQTTLMQESHAQMAELIPEPFHGQIRCIMFNLGYLPGTDKSVTTTIDSTIAALERGCSLLANHGLISLLAYTGHAGGMEEYTAVKAWAKSLNTEEYKVSVRNLLPDHNNPPHWILIERLSAPL